VLRPLSVLVVEDSLDDWTLIHRELTKAGYDVSWEQVVAAGELRAALREGGWDLCIADYSLPSFGAPEALAIVRAEVPNLPFIVVSGTIGEERAVALMRAGADDYFLKGNLGRLGAAIQRALSRAAELGRTESRLEAIMAGILEGVVATDAGGTITFFNASATRIFGYGAKEIIGRPIAELFPERVRRDQQRFLEFIGDRAVAEATGVLLGRRASGEDFPIEATVSRTRLDGEGVVTVVIRDITEQRRASAELRESEGRAAALELQKGVLEEAARAKSAFIASMNHELRTPLNAILGFSKLLLEQAEVGEKHRRYLKNVEDAGGHLLALISDVLDLASLDAAKMKLRPESIDLAGLVEPALAAARVGTEGKGLRFEVSIPDGVVLWADPVRVREILHNLLSNAVKFTPSGGAVSLDVCVDGSALMIEVGDDGAGIPEASHDRVFGAFERFHEGVVAAPGTGLGLALTKQLVDLHGGTITFESARGRGTTFRARLPATVASSAPWVSRPPVAEAAGRTTAPVRS